MTTGRHMELSQANLGEWHVPSVPQASIDRANRLLQTNHEQYHVFFNDRGFHNHITHYLLTQVSLGATPNQMDRAFNQERRIQRGQFPVDNDVVEQMKVPEYFASCFSKEIHYRNFLTFFENQIIERGVGAVVQENLFSGTPNAEHLLKLMFASFLHPLIHFGFGIEYDQPAVVAEGLAQGCVHQPEVIDIFNGPDHADEAASGHAGGAMVDLINEVQQNETIRNAPCWGDGSWIPDDPYASAPPELWQIAARWRVLPVEVEIKTAEMINVNAFFTAAAQRPGKKAKLDFFLIHNVNCSIFFSAFLRAPYLTAANRARLLELKGRFDIVAYAARGSPKLYPDEVLQYKAKRPGMDWPQVIARCNTFLDDCHVAKFIRALAHGASVTQKYGAGQTSKTFPMSVDMFLLAAHMALDSTEGVYYFYRWIRGAGFDAQWENFPDKTDETAKTANALSKY